MASVMNGVWLYHPQGRALKEEWERKHYRSFPTCLELVGLSECVCVRVHACVYMYSQHLLRPVSFRMTTQKRRFSRTQKDNRRWLLPSA